MEYLPVVGAVLLALPLGYLIAQARAALRLSELSQQRAQLQQRMDELLPTLDRRTQDLQAAETERNALRTDLAVAKEQAEAARQGETRLSEELRLLGEKRDQLHLRLSEEERQRAAAEASLLAEQKKSQSQTVEIQGNHQELEKLRAALGKVNEEHTQLRTTLTEKQNHFDQQLKQFDDQRVILKKEFENLANQILESKGKTFSEQSRQSLDDLLKPFREQITEFRTKVEDIHHKETQQQAEMRTELKQLQSMHQQMTQEAHNLTTALQGQKKMQGNWGELILENVLDRSGLQKGKDYEREVSFTTEEGRSRPDAIVYLPDNKHLIIDAKVSLAAYTRYVNAEDEVERQQALREHVQAVSDRIRELSDRDYYRLPGLNSPEMVFMFVPIESAFVEALKSDETLFQKAIEQNVLVATPTTLLTSLNIVRQLWRFEAQNAHTAELADKAAKVYDKLNGFLASLESVGGALRRAQESYDKAYGQLYTGKGNLIKQANEFRTLGVSVKAELPAHLVEKAELELTHQPVEDVDPLRELASGE